MKTGLSATLTIMLDIWSGLPNPTWQLSGALADELLRRLGAVQESTTNADDPPALGYRGIVVSSEGNEALPSERRIYTAPVSNRSPGSWNRTACALELWLLDSGRDSVDSAVLDEIRRERRIESGPE